MTLESVSKVNQQNIAVMPWQRWVMRFRDCNFATSQLLWDFRNYEHG